MSNENEELAVALQDLRTRWIEIVRLAKYGDQLDGDFDTLAEVAEALLRPVPAESARWPEKAIRAYRRKWRKITGVNPPHEGNTTHEHALAAALAAPAQTKEKP